MVANGLALSYRKYSTDYVRAETFAKARKEGMRRERLSLRGSGVGNRGEVSLLPMKSVYPLAPNRIDRRESYSHVQIIISQFALFPFGMCWNSKTARNDEFVKRF